MKRFLACTLPLIIIGVALIAIISNQNIHSEPNTQTEETMDQKKPATLPTVPKGYEIATFAAGCYWCVEAVYVRLDGVHSSTSGFIGGHVANPKYEDVCAETTGHTEAVQIVFDPKKISYAKLLDWFWRLHDPTTLNQQGNDIGTQYRSGIYYHNDGQKQQATASRNKAQESFPKPIVTEITKASTFYTAKVSHQDYYKINGTKDPYCRVVIGSKLKKLKLDK